MLTRQAAAGQMIFTTAQTHLACTVGRRRMGGLYERKLYKKLPYLSTEKTKGVNIMKSEKIDLDYVLNELAILGAGQLNTIIGFSTVGWAAGLDLKDRLADAKARDHHVRIAEGLAWMFYEITLSALSINKSFDALPECWEEHKAAMAKLRAENS